MQSTMETPADRRFAPASQGFNDEWTVIDGIRVVKRGVTELIGHKLRTACGVERDFLVVHFEDTHAVAIMARELHRCP